MRARGQHGALHRVFVRRSGRGAPARTATATPECTRSTSLPATTRPAAMSLSIASAPSTTRSKASPACTRLAASTPPTDSNATATPLRCSQARGQLGQHRARRHRRDAGDALAHGRAVSARGMKGETILRRRQTMPIEWRR